MTTTCGRWRTRSQGCQGGRHLRRPGRGDRSRHDRLERDPGRRGHGAARRLLSLVRPPRQERGRRNHRLRRTARSSPAIDWCGGVYSAEWGFAKLLHWLRHNPDKREQFVSAFEHCDMVAATLAGITDPRRVKRSICAAGHKWLWHADYGGLPPEDFLVKVDPLLKGVRAKLDGEYATSDKIEGTLSPAWAEKLGLKAGIPDSGRRLRCPLGRDRRGGARRAMWSTSSARPPASSPMPGRRD